MLNNFKNSLVLQKQVSSSDRITPLCEYSSVSGNSQVSLFNPTASKGFSPKWKHIVLKVFYLHPVVVFFLGGGG